MTYHQIWLAWTAYMSLGVIWFIVVEVLTGFNRVSGDTLSEVVWSLNVPPVVWFLGAGLILGLIAWLVPHFTSGGRWGI